MPWKRTKRIAALALLLGIVSTVIPCAAQTSGNVQLWIEQEVWFEANDQLLYGVLCMPPTDGPHPAVVLITGAINSTSSWVDGANTPALVNHARRLAIEGFATLRFDPAGVGQSEGDGTIRNLDMRMTEALAAASFVQNQSSIYAERVGLWGASQGGWVIAMAAAQAPESIAFLIMVSGTTISVAQQQVYGVEMQTRAAGLSESDIAKAVTVIQLLIDWQISDPIFTPAYEEAISTLGDGPWDDLYAIVHAPPGDRTAAERLAAVIEILESIQNEPWTQSLYLREIYLPSLRSIPPEQEDVASAAMEASLLANPRAYFVKVTCPMLALFGEDDVHLPAHQSAELLREYVAESGNDDLTVVIFENAGHSMNSFMPAYWTELNTWLGDLYE